MKHIFCIEDDSNILEMIEYTLNAMSFKVSGFGCATDFFEGLKTEKPILILLDIMLPDKDGIQIMKELKNSIEYSNIPIILVTAKTDQMNKIKGLDSGADDYITKPFDIMELISRINAVLRRCNDNTSATITFGDIKVDVDAHKVYYKSEPITLTFKEFELLKMLIKNKGKVLTRDVLMNCIWGTDFEGETRTVDVHIRTLRQKLGDGGNYIETIRNVGYKIDGINNA